MRCGNCGNENAEGAKFCRYCGAKQVQATAPTRGNMGAQEETAILGAQEERTITMSQRTMGSQTSTGFQRNMGAQNATAVQRNTGARTTTMSQKPVIAPCQAPALQLPTGRSLVKMIFLSLITCGIYGIVIQSRISSEINITASRYDGKRTIPYLAAFWLMYITLGIYGLVWNHQFAKRIGNEVKRRGYEYNFGASDFWLWNVLGSLIIVGPFIYCHKLMKSMNMINTSYNMYG